MMLIYSLITVNFDYNAYLQKLLEKSISNLINRLMI